ncbi:DUF6789 family protein [Halalkalicoccus tibetensis]|uniref:DUF6789 family protein n=1 Tax=Halalkalicoccus tibetensis TaxID=175632 RepID=A0ABD5V8X2_9EURY
MDDRITALVSGALATAAMLAAVYLAEVVAGYRVLVYQLFGGVVTIPETVGLVVFVAFGVLVWPTVFLIVGENLAPTREGMRGVVLALLLWIAFFVALVPAFDVTELFPFIAASLLAHLVYGLVLGLSFEALDGEHRDWRA